MDKKEDISYQRLGEALFQRFRQLSTQRMGAAELWEQLAAHAVEQIDARRATLAAGTTPPGARPVGVVPDSDDYGEDPLGLKPGEVVPR